MSAPAQSTLCAAFHDERNEGLEIGTFYIDTDELLDQIDDDDLLDGVHSRKLHLGVPQTQTPFGSSYVELAYEALKAGRSSEALALLDRAIFPTGATHAPDGQLQFKASL